MNGKRKIPAALLMVATGAMVLPGCVVREQTTVYEPPPPRRVYVEQAPPQTVIVQPAPTVVGPAPVIVQPAPVIVQPAPVVVVQPNVIVIHRAPPPVQVEIRTRSPGREYVWVPGYWRARGEAWEWVAGAWARPPHPGAVWVGPRYETVGPEVHFSLGFWR